MIARHRAEAVTEGAPAAASGGLVLDADAVLASFPSPAVLLDPLGRALAANPAGGALARYLQDEGADNALRSTVAAALADRNAGARDVELAGDDRSHTVLDVALPMTAADGAQRVLLLGRETTVERSFIDALVESRRLFRDLVSVSSDFAWETDAEGRFGFVSPRGAIGYTAQELNGRVAYELLDPGHGEPELFPFDSRVPLEEAEVWLEDKNGDPACLVVSCVPVTGKDGEYRGTRGVSKDVTVTRARDAALTRAENRAHLLNRIMEAIRSEAVPAEMASAAAAATAAALDAPCCWILRGAVDVAVAACHGPEAEEAGLTEAVTAAAPRLAPGHADAVSAPGHALLAAATAYQGTVNGAIAVARHADSAPFDEDQSSLLAEVADRLGIALEQVANTELLEKLSRTDPLTGLLNRRAFFEEVDRRLLHQRRTARSAALLYVDLDNFKLVNDALGHQAGDDVLREVAVIVTHGSRVGDACARLGGDEFALWLEDADEEAARAKAAALQGGMSALAAHNADPDRPLSLSIGIAISEGLESSEALLARADAAMYAAKRGGKGRLVVALSAGRGA